ncbi:DMT family transporter [Fluviispira sanaruensis]|uniref:Guanidinium exporter n=1 Tax=Fluviispira sanaruensis TaxID=2493639 RepID=A0A4P2VGH7_FLUSA|nr:multidrug efflux SMR transporter [Fluviispira sanaruensis]BBH51701.1 quaternary ammonium compound-resistance protein SugE [Fluviispira sanaruensis]
MAWAYLVLAGLFEVVWAIHLKDVDGISATKPLVITLIGMIISFGFLSLALKKLPIGTAYAVWTGIGALGVAIYGIIFIGESASLLRILSLIVLVLGILGLKFFTPQKN